MTSVTEKVSKSICKVSSYLCEHCNYKTAVKSNYIKHCLTAKHKNVTSVTFRDAKSIDPDTTKHFCCKKCNKVYQSRNGLWEHSKRCITEPESGSENPVNNIDTNLIMELIKQNKDLHNVLMHQSEIINKLTDREPTNSVVNNTTNNNQFNLSFFLNETCKDAMSLQEFVDNIKITFEELLTIGNAGFVNGISDIFIKQLSDLEVTKRPIHCTDLKRETIYFKEEDSWNKDKNNEKLKNIIEKVEYKNVVALQQWCNENPDARINNTDKNLLRDKIYLQTLQGDETTREKIIRNISKEITIDKNNI